MSLKFLLFPTFLCFSLLSFSQDSSQIKVHFLYGSKPLMKYKATEKKWFGGILGGHVGIEGDKGKFYSFEGRGKLHIFSKKKNRHSIFREIDSVTFWNIMGTRGDSVKKATITVPVSVNQKQKLDSITSNYIAQTPYDYAVFGMRCGASTYEILAQMSIMKPRSFFVTYMKIFYPRKLRKRLLKKAERNEWPIFRKQGSDRRKWERDV